MSTPNLDAINKAITLAGGQSAVARALRLTRSAITPWTRGQIPLERAVQLESLCNGAVTHREMRPDIFQPVVAQDVSQSAVA